MCPSLWARHSFLDMTWINHCLTSCRFLVQKVLRGYRVKSKSWTRSAELYEQFETGQFNTTSLDFLIDKTQVSVLQLSAPKHCWESIKCNYKHAHSHTCAHTHSLTYTHMCTCIHKSTLESFSFYYSNQWRENLWGPQGHGAWAGGHPSQEGVGEGTAHCSWSKQKQT